ncbi:hypothetical protein T03_8631 [Trichinella britovi]|uniref:Uncharacterized protein n=2 Tax=Trichinella TaxID=6333 RepID=A0A0V1DEL2_TRIBR|nr:hypothetical protein T05_3528 [Trichinella murrelli]KRX68930.1 hypothetical protein T09_5547 [Trichinella sp. T9]KRX73875.1 hypothetical protein T06_7461 [Trichinella sp. T6]KRY59803.1 hypothetical protein T03_8631 [Trichinella britovi]KRZ95021.1 hypothetical protein T08_5818 [Trichinella sp. T8]
MIKPALECIYTVGQVKRDDRFLTDRYHISQWANFSRPDASYMGIDFVGRLLEQAGSPWRVSCGKRKKPANLAPSARDDDWISEIESID